MKFFNKALRILLLTNGIILISGAMLGPIYALFVEEIGGSLLDVSLMAGIFAIVAGITSLVSGKYADKLKHPERIVAIGYAIIGSGFIGYIFVKSIIVLFIIQAFIGFGEAFYSPAYDAVYSKHLAKTKRGREWGAWESMNYFTAAGGAVIGGFIATYLGFNTLFILMGTITFISAIAMLYFGKRIL